MANLKSDIINDCNENAYRFNVGYRIGFSGLMPDGTLGLPQFMAYVQEASLFHTFSIEGAFAYYEKMNWVWVLTHWQVEIATYPKVGDNINIATWPVQFKGYFAERGFYANNAAGDIILSANSNWVLLDRNTYKPIRPNNEVCSKYGSCSPLMIPKDFALPKHIENDFTPLSRHSYTAARRDIDTNMHVNNTKYLEWLYCYLPDEIYQNYCAKSLKVAYKKETLLGDVLDIRLFKQEIGGTMQIFAIIEKENQTATEMYIELQRM